MTAQVIINEQHSLLEEQKDLLVREFGTGWDLFPVPAEGWTEAQQYELSTLLGEGPVVFASPVPLLLALMSRWTTVEVFLFHNDNRDKKELPNGKVIYTVAKTGWRLIKV